MLLFYGELNHIIFFFPLCFYYCECVCFCYLFCIDHFNVVFFEEFSVSLLFIMNMVLYIYIYIYIYI